MIKYLTLVFPCIVSITVNDDQQDATILAYLFIPNPLYMFRAMSAPIVKSTWLFLQLLISSTDIAAGRCHGWDGTPFNPIRDSRRQHYRWTILDTVNIESAPDDGQRHRPKHVERIKNK